MLKKQEQTFLYYLNINKMALFVIIKVYDNLPERKNFGKAYINECCKENISVDEVFFNNDNDCYFFLVLCSYASLRFDMIYIIRARKFHFMGRFSRKFHFRKYKKLLFRVLQSSLENEDL